MQAFFGVFDGHGGSKAAEFVAGNLDKAAMAEVLKRSGDAIEEAIKEAYLTTDMDFLKEDVGGGTCCVTAMIHKGDLVVSNAGDCRAVLSRNGVAEALTSDHHLSRQDERARIEALVIDYFSWCALFFVAIQYNEEFKDKIDNIEIKICVLTLNL